MKIGLVCPYSINKHGGVQEVILALYDGLKQKGHEVRIITPKPRGDYDQDMKDVIFFGNSTDFRAVASTTSQVSSIEDNKLVDSIFEHEQFDILHFHEPWIPLLSRQLLQRSKSVNIATFHSKIPEALVTRTIIKVVTPYLKSVMSYIHEYTSVSASGAEYVSMLTDEPITIIPNGIDLNKYHTNKKTAAAKGKTILYIGRLERRKGLKYLMRAFQVYAQENPDALLLIAGDGPDREKLELLADDLKLTNINFLGYVSEELKLELLEQADLFCSPAVFGESFGIVLLESMAMGTVCIAGNNSGYTDLLEGVGAISLVNPEDTEEFARRIEILMTETKLRKIWQDWAKEYVTQFNNPQIVDDYESFYIEALKEHHGEIRAIA